MLSWLFAHLCPLKTLYSSRKYWTKHQFIHFLNMKPSLSYSVRKLSQQSLHAGFENFEKAICVIFPMKVIPLYCLYGFPIKQGFYTTKSLARLKINLLQREFLKQWRGNFLLNFFKLSKLGHRTEKNWRLIKLQNSDSRKASWLFSLLNGYSLFHSMNGDGFPILNSVGNLDCGHRGQPSCWVFHKEVESQSANS